MYTWSEMSAFQKVVHVLSLVSAAVWFVLAILNGFAIWKCTGLMHILHILFGVVCLGMGVLQKNKTLKILWFILAAVRVILSIVEYFF